jgi:hypothetical protein
LTGTSTPVGSSSSFFFFGGFQLDVATTYYLVGLVDKRFQDEFGFCGWLESGTGQDVAMPDSSSGVKPCGIWLGSSHTNPTSYSGTYSCKIHIT